MIELIIFFQVVIVVGGPLFLLYINKRIGSYACEIGKITALSDKIDDIVEQQKQITQATEETKAEVNHLAWIKKESQTKKIEKLEEYLQKVFEAVEMIREDVENPKINALPITFNAKLITIQMLYLSELETENNKFMEILDQYESIINELISNQLDHASFHNKAMPIFAKLAIASKKITTKSKEIVNQLYNINDAQ